MALREGRLGIYVLNYSEGGLMAVLSFENTFHNL